MSENITVIIENNNYNSDFNNNDTKNEFRIFFLSMGLLDFFAVRSGD
jgi:hypothetical protein